MIMKNQLKNTSLIARKIHLTIGNTNELDTGTDPDNNELDQSV